MTDKDRLNFIRSVLTLADDDYDDLWQSIWWMTDGEYAPVTFFVNCNDLFVWACADSETLTPENLLELLQAVADVRAALGATEPVQGGTENKEEWHENFDRWYQSGGFGALLFCARQRKLRSQRPYYRRFPEPVAALFDACGSVRDPKTEG